MILTALYELERDDDIFELEITYQESDGCLDILDVTYGGDSFDTTTSEDEAIYTYLECNLSEALEEAAADEADYRRDLYREARDV